MSLEREYTVVYIVDANQATTTLGALKATAAATTQAFRAAADAVDQFANRASQSAADARQAGASLGTLNTALDKAKTEASLAASQVYKLHANINETGAAATGATPQIAGMATAMGTVHAETVQATGSVGGFALKMFALEKGVEVIEAIGEQFAASRKFIKEAAEEAEKFRDSLREIANLRGENAPSDKLLGEMQLFGLDTGLKEGDATEFISQFEGAVPAARARGHIKQDVEKGLAREAATMGARVGLDAGTTGKLAGLLGEYTNVDSVAKGAGQMQMVVDHLNNGVGHISKLAPALIGMIGSMVDENGGRFASVPQAAAVFGATTVRARNGFNAANQIRGANALMRGFDGNDAADLRKKQESGHKLTEREKASLSLQELGITPGMDYLTALKTMDAKVPKKNRELWLAQHGFDNKTEVEHWVKQAALIPVMDAELARDIDKAGKQRDAARGGEAIAANRDFFRNSKLGEARRVRRTQEAQGHAIGLEEEEFNLAAEMGTVRVNARPGYRGSWQASVIGFLKRTPVVKDFANGIIDVEREMGERSATFNLLKEMDRLGIGQEKTRELVADPITNRKIKVSETEHMRALLETGPLEAPQSVRREFYKKWSPLVKKAGGDIIGGDGGVRARMEKIASGEHEPGTLPSGAQLPGPTDALAGHEFVALPPGILDRLGKAGRSVTPADKAGWHQGMGPGGASNPAEMRTLQERILRTLEKIERNGRGAGAPAAAVPAPRPPAAAPEPKRP